MTRPDHLPDYSRPPLDEVVLGVQFASVPVYASVDAKGIWDLYRQEFPRSKSIKLSTPSSRPLVAQTCKLARSSL